MTQRELRLLQYALHMLIANFDDQAEEDLDVTAQEGEAEVYSLGEKLGVWL